MHEFVDHYVRVCDYVFNFLLLVVHLEFEVVELLLDQHLRIYQACLDCFTFTFYFSNAAMDLLENVKFFAVVVKNVFKLEQFFGFLSADPDYVLDCILVLCNSVDDRLAQFTD